MNVRELCHALAVEDEDGELFRDGIPSYEILISASAGLIRVNEKSGL